MMTRPPFRDIIAVEADGHPVVAHIGGADPGTAPVVVAAHGITANAFSWARIVDQLDDVATVVAIDLRGRGDSAAHPGPYGMEAHGRDCVAVLEHLGASRAVLVGHSMGAIVVARAATRFPDQVGAVVFVDGGLPIGLPADVEPERAVDVVVGPAVARIGTAWPDLDAVYDMWKGHPAFRHWDRWAELFIDHDVAEGPDGQLHCRVSETAVRFDGAEALVDPAASQRIFEVAAPAWLLRAPRGLLDDPAAPLLSGEAVDELRRVRPDMEVIEMAPDVNHYNIMWADSSAPTVAETIRAALEGT